MAGPQQTARPRQVVAAGAPVLATTPPAPAPPPARVVAQDWRQYALALGAGAALALHGGVSAVSAAPARPVVVAQAEAQPVPGSAQAQSGRVFATPPTATPSLSVIASAVPPPPFPGAVLTATGGVSPAGVGQVRPVLVTAPMPAQLLAGSAFWQMAVVAADWAGPGPCAVVAAPEAPRQGGAALYRAGSPPDVFPPVPPPPRLASAQVPPPPGSVTYLLGGVVSLSPVLPGPWFVEFAQAFVPGGEQAGRFLAGAERADGFTAGGEQGQVAGL